MQTRYLASALAPAVARSCHAFLQTGAAAAAGAAPVPWLAVAERALPACLRVSHPASDWAQRRTFSAEGSARDGSAPSGASEADRAAAQMVQMMEAMMNDPSTQQLLLSRMPPHMRRPEIVKAMMANPEVRQRIAALAQQTGLHKMMSGLGADRIAAGIDATRKAGMDPGPLFGRFMSSPSLALKLKDPRVLAALMDVVSNGPKALEKYSGDKTVVEAWIEASELLEQQRKEEEAEQQRQQAAAGAQQQQAASASEASASAAVEGGSSQAERMLGVKPEELMARVMGRPELMQRVQDPEVQQALTEVAARPWKIVKYLFNSKVMGALKEMRDVLKETRSKA